MQNLIFDYISRYVSLTDDERNAMAGLDVFRSVKKGTILLKAGQKSRDGYFVLKGCLRTYYIKEGEEKTTEFYTEMEGITPNCVVTNEPSEYYVAAIEDSIIAQSNPDMEADMFERFPKFESLCRILSEELIVKQQTSIDDFKTSSPEQRYLSMLQNRSHLIQRVPQHQLASYLGIKPQSLSRLRARILEKSKH